MERINKILIFVFSIISLCFGVYYINISEIDRLGACFTMPLVLLLPTIGNKIFKLNFSRFLNFTYILFVIVAQFFGSVIYLYDSVWWYDLFCHFISGILTSVLALNILKHFKIDSKKEIFSIIFVVCFTISIAALWEYLECFIDLIFKSNVQHYIETGTRDTITDMLMATISSVIFSMFHFKKR